MQGKLQAAASFVFTSSLLDPVPALSEQDCCRLHTTCLNPSLEGRTQVKPGLQGKIGIKPR